MRERKARKKRVQNDPIHFQDRAAAVVSLCVNLSCLLAVLAEPFMPSLSATLLQQLNANMDDVNVLLAKEKGQGNGVFIIAKCIKYLGR